MFFFGFLIFFCFLFFFDFFFFNDTATTEIYTLSLHDALPISWWRIRRTRAPSRNELAAHPARLPRGRDAADRGRGARRGHHPRARGEQLLWPRRWRESPIRRNSMRTARETVDRTPSCNFIAHDSRRTGASSTSRVRNPDRRRTPRGLS